MKNNPFEQFMNPITKTAEIENFGEIKYVQLTEAELQDLQVKTLKGMDSEGNVKDADILYEVKYEKIAKSLVEPKVTVAQLKKLRGATKILEHILTAISGDDMVDEEGN